MRASFHKAGRLGRSGSLRDPSSGRTARWIAGAALLGLAVVSIPIVQANQDRTRAADDLTRQALVGPRPLTCERIVVLPDVSGSMTGYAKVREDALATLAAWAPSNLRKDDQLAVVRWADTAAVDAPPTDVSGITSETFTPGTVDVGRGNDIVPSVEDVADMPDTSCHTSLIYISDGEVTTPADRVRLDAAVRAGAIDAVSLVLPTSGTAPSYWLELFPYSMTFQADPNDAQQTARALGQAIASATGQQLALKH